MASGLKYIIIVYSVLMDIVYTYGYSVYLWIYGYSMLMDIVYLWI